VNHQPNHPFPYFDLAVTRDAHAIKAMVEKKYRETKKFENHTTLGHRYKDFIEHALLLARPSYQKPGEFNADPAKVERIVGACLQLVESHFLSLGSWAARVVQAGGGAFVGALWPVTERGAVAFAREFYAALAAGVPIAHAVQQARLRIRQKDDPTWLAYRCFANPLARWERSGADCPSES
jgi:hypothetical protein